MFGLFKKTKWKLEGKRFDFFEQVFSQLPEEFQFLAKGLRDGVYKAYIINHSLQGHHFAISFAGGSYDKSMETIGKSFVLENIEVVGKGQIFPLAISVYDGLWIGFEFGKDVAGFDNFQVGLSKMTKERMPGSLEIERLTQGLSSEKLDLLSLGEIEVDGMHYFQIKDLEDGNYIAIDEKGTVYGLLHDPFKIEKISDSLKQFVQDVNKGRFDFEQYLEGKNGYIN